MNSNLIGCILRVTKRGRFLLIKFFKGRKVMKVKFDKHNKQLSILKENTSSVISEAVFITVYRDPKLNLPKKINANMTVKEAGLGF